MYSILFFIHCFSFFHYLHGFFNFLKTFKVALLKSLCTNSIIAIISESASINLHFSHMTYISLLLCIGRDIFIGYAVSPCSAKGSQKPCANAALSLPFSPLWDSALGIPAAFLASDLYLWLQLSEVAVFCSGSPSCSVV